MTSSILLLVLSGAFAQLNLQTTIAPDASLIESFMGQRLETQLEGTGTCNLSLKQKRGDGQGSVRNQVIPGNVFSLDIFDRSTGSYQAFVRTIPYGVVGDIVSCYTTGSSTSEQNCRVIPDIAERTKTVMKHLMHKYGSDINTRCRIAPPVWNYDFTKTPRTRAYKQCQANCGLSAIGPMPVPDDPVECAQGVEFKGWWNPCGDKAAIARVKITKRVGAQCLSKKRVCVINCDGNDRVRECVKSKVELGSIIVRDDCKFEGPEISSNTKSEDYYRVACHENSQKVRL